MRYFKLPDLGEGLQEAEIVEWHVAPGDEVEVDQLIVSVETAKAIVEVPSPCTGKIATLFGAAGDLVHIGEPLVEFAGGQDVDSGTVVGKLDSADASEEKGGSEDQFIIGAAGSKPRNEVLATPAIRQLARRLNVDLEDVTASGAHGVITHADVERAARLTESHGESSALHGVRRSMASAMTRAHAEVAKVTIHDDVDIHRWPAGTDLTMRLVRAIALACEKEPALNCWYDGKNQRRRIMERVDLGIAVDTPDGLFVPVLRDIRQRKLTELRQGLDNLRAAVKSRKIPPAEMLGATITLSNFGTMAGRYADPIVVPPMVAIIGAGRKRDEVVAWEGESAVHPILPLSVSFDHRAVTGGEASRFLAAMMGDLEQEE